MALFTIMNWHCLYEHAPRSVTAGALRPGALEWLSRWVHMNARALHSVALINPQGTKSMVAANTQDEVFFPFEASNYLLNVHRLKVAPRRLHDEAKAGKLSRVRVNVRDLRFLKSELDGYARRRLGLEPSFEKAAVDNTEELFQ
jgi:hypothetical protein